MKKKPFHDSFFWLIGLLIIVSILAILSSCSHPPKSPQGNGNDSPKTTGLLYVARTDGYTDNDPATAVTTGPNRQLFGFSFYNHSSSTDIGIQNIKFHLAIPVLMRISSLKLYDDSGTLVSMINHPTTNTEMLLHYIIPMGTTKSFSLKADIDHGLQETIQESMFNVTAFDAFTNEPITALHLTNSHPVSMSEPENSAIVIIRQP